MNLNWVRVLNAVELVNSILTSLQQLLLGEDWKLRRTARTVCHVELNHALQVNEGANGPAKLACCTILRPLSPRQFNCYCVIHLTSYCNGIVVNCNYQMLFHMKYVMVA